MSDQITAKGSESKFKAHPEGQYVGQCVDTIDLGEDVHDFPGDEKYLKHMCALVFRTGERNEQTGTYIDVAREFTVSMGDKANLRKFLEQWRGKPYDASQIADGVPLDKLTGNFGLLTIAHRKSGKGRTYANITACVGIPKQMAASAVPFGEYFREPYWETKKKDYAEKAARFAAESAVSNEDFSDYPGAPEDDDDLPF